jgi:hypothetical protein
MKKVLNKIIDTVAIAAFSFLFLGLVLISLDEYWQYLYG